MSRLHKHTSGAHDLLRPSRAERLLNQLNDPKKAKYMKTAMALVHDRMAAHQTEHVDQEDDSWRAPRGYESDQESVVSNTSSIYLLNDYRNKRSGEHV
jgi:hypothetical protein